MLKVLVMVSGGGTNLQAIIDSVENGTVTNTKIVGVISNNQNAYALKRADKHGIAAECVSPKNFENRAAFNEKLLERVNSYEPDLIVLAGFLVVIPPEMIAAYRNRMINIHPVSYTHLDVYKRQDGVLEPYGSRKRRGEMRAG